MNSSRRSITRITFEQHLTDLTGLSNFETFDSRSRQARCRQQPFLAIESPDNLFLIIDCCRMHANYKDHLHTDPVRPSVPLAMFWPRFSLLIDWLMHNTPDYLETKRLPKSLIMQLLHIWKISSSHSYVLLGKKSVNCSMRRLSWVIPVRTSIWVHSQLWSHEKIWACHTIKRMSMSHNKTHRSIATRLSGWSRAWS